MHATYRHLHEVIGRCGGHQPPLQLEVRRQRLEKHGLDLAGHAGANLFELHASAWYHAVRIQTIAVSEGDDWSLSSHQ